MLRSLRSNRRPKMSEKEIKLFPFIHKFFEYDPPVAAHILETMEEEEALLILKTLPPSLTANVCKHLNVAQAAQLLQEVPQEILSAIVENLEPEAGAAILQSVPEEFQNRIISILPPATKKKIEDIITYPEHSAGRLMSSEYIYFHSDIRVEDAIQKLRWLAHIKHPSSYVYVVDTEGKLAGVLNMRELILADPDSTLDKVMIENVFAINAFTDIKEVAKKLSNRGYFAAPVVDNEGHLLGIIKAGQFIKQGHDRASRDLQKMFGAGSNEKAFSPIGFSLRKRLPWLHFNLAMAFIAGLVVAMFEDTIATLTVLAVFLPVIADQGGNAGSQSLAVLMRGVVMKEVTNKNRYDFVLKEGKLALLNGIAIGLVTGVVVWLWQENLDLAIVTGFAMLITLIVAGVSGALVPMIMKSLGLDPAQSSAIIVTTVTDVIGIFVFLGLAALFQNYMIQ